MFVVKGPSVAVPASPIPLYAPEYRFFLKVENSFEHDFQALAAISTPAIPQDRIVALVDRAQNLEARRTASRATPALQKNDRQARAASVAQLAHFRSR